MLSARPPIERFMEKVVVDANGCWLWTASCGTDGYGQFRSGGQGSLMVRAHRFAYEHFIAAIPEGLTIDHLCRVRHCVNPEHLEPVTNLENQHRSSMTLAGMNARKTHCKNNHPLSGDNLYVSPDGRRYCRICHRASRDRWNAENKHKYVEYSRKYRAEKRGEVSPAPLAS